MYICTNKCSREHLGECGSGILFTKQNCHSGSGVCVCVCVLEFLPACWAGGDDAKLIGLLSSVRRSKQPSLHTLSLASVSLLFSRQPLLISTGFSLISSPKMISPILKVACYGFYACKSCIQLSSTEIS